MKIKCYLNDSETFMQKALATRMSISFLKLKCHFNKEKVNKGKPSIRIFFTFFSAK